jgi:predicted DNA-binding transcriptional regulator AlpA
MERNMEPVMVDTDGAAARVGLKPSTLEALRSRGGGPAYVKLGRTVRYRVADLDAWVAARVIGSTGDQMREPRA